VVLRLAALAVTVFAISGWGGRPAESIPSDTTGWYVAATDAPDTLVLRLTPGEPSGAVWLEMSFRPASSDEVLPARMSFRVRILGSGFPIFDPEESPSFLRYLLEIPETGEVLDYRDAVTGHALLPPWRDFVKEFLPTSTEARREAGFPESCRWLGRSFDRQEVPGDRSPARWADARVLTLDPGRLVGTGRYYRDTGGGRLPPDEEYEYAPFTQADFRAMIDAGFNVFRVLGEQEGFVRGESVFYLRGVSGDPPLRFPADLFRSNYLGQVMYADEPAVRLLRDPERPAGDPTALASELDRRVRETLDSEGPYGRGQLARRLRASGHALFGVPVVREDIPVWDALYETAHLQFGAGATGFVHEGRYRPGRFADAVERILGERREFSAEEVLRVHFAFLRGAARQFGGDWGTSIYGQCDREIAERALLLASDLGARYLWFWTSDKGHHVPWEEQRALARALADHCADRERPPHNAWRDPAGATALVLPPNAWPSFRRPVFGLRPSDDRTLDRAVLQSILGALDAGEDFDILTEARPVPDGYGRVEWIH
jgi:hypothetical protein